MSLLVEIVECNSMPWQAISSLPALATLGASHPGVEVNILDVEAALIRAQKLLPCCQSPGNRSGEEPRLPKGLD